MLNVSLDFAIDIFWSAQAFLKAGFSAFQVSDRRVADQRTQSQVEPPLSSGPVARTSHASFLRSDWDAPGLLAVQARRIVQSMKPRRGEPIHLIIDDTQIQKRGKKIDGVSTIWNQTSLSFIHGHVVVELSVQKALRGSLIVSDASSRVAWVKPLATCGRTLKPKPFDLVTLVPSVKKYSVTINRLACSLL